MEINFENDDIREFIISGQASNRPYSKWRSNRQLRIDLDKVMRIPTAPIHPFDIVEDEIAARGLTKKEFAESIGMKPSNFSRMIKTKGELTSEMALKLEAALDIPYSHWMRYQEQYVKDSVRLNPSVSENTTGTSYDDLYAKITSAIRPIKERMESLNDILASGDKGISSNISEAQINSIEDDMHRLGRALCELRLS